MKMVFRDLKQAPHEFFASLVFGVYGWVLYKDISDLKLLQHSVQKTNMVLGRPQTTRDFLSENKKRAKGSIHFC